MAKICLRIQRAALTLSLTLKQGRQWSYMVVQEMRPEDPAKVLLMRRADAVDVCPREILQAIHAKGHAWIVTLLQVAQLAQVACSHQA